MQFKSACLQVDMNPLRSQASCITLLRCLKGSFLFNLSKALLNFSFEIKLTTKQTSLTLFGFCINCLYATS